MIEELEAKINEAVSTGFRGRLLDRGQARSMIWDDGALPDDAPKFSSELSYDLLSYGYSLISMGMRLLELEGNPDVYRAAFSKAASAIEMVTHKGERDDPSRGFHIILAASSYHLGRYSAKAYSLLKNNNENLTESEKALCRIILRELNQLENIIYDFKLSQVGHDNNLVALINVEHSRISKMVDAGDDIGDSIYELSFVDIALTDNYLSAVSMFLMAFELGEREFLDKALEILSNNLNVCNDLNMVPQWWVHRITIYLLNDLWLSSFHEILPLTQEAEWNNLRWYFIALLHKRRKSEIDLWPSQIEGVRRAVDQSDNLVVSLPTSAGKTRIAEICILRCLADGKRVMFITPLRALSAQTEVGLRKTFLPLGKTVSTLYGSIGTSDFEKDAISTNDIVVGTPEKIDFALRNDPSLIDDVGLVVLDEGHMIGLNERELRYEVQIQRLLKRPDADQRRIVCLSAILPEGDQLEDFVGWIRQDKEGDAIKNDWRPTDLRFGEVIWNQNTAQLNFRIGDERPFVKRFISGSVPPIGQRTLQYPKNAQELSLATAWRLTEDGHTVLIYCPQKTSVESFAKVIVDLHMRGALGSVLTADQESLRLVKMLGAEWLGTEHPILKCLDLGVAIHHGSLPTPFRKEVEKLLSEGVLKITVSSPTLAQGLNLSATTVIFHSLYRSGKIIEASEFKNVIGRAGRAFIDIQGLIIHPMFNRHNWRRSEWEALIQDVKTRNMESGLYRLVYSLIIRMVKHIGTRSSDDVMEYIVNNANCWNFPEIDNESEDDEAEEKEKWSGYISSLDTALLSLLGNEECAEEEIPEILDDILSSSLWQRRLERQREGIQELLNQSVINRATYIWRQSSALQRRGYFLAGVGLETGAKLDAIAPQANALLVNANYFIIKSHADEAISSITQLAELIFTIEPFSPDVLPENWKNILETWLKGDSVVGSRLGEIGDILQFVENDLVYRLPWGMEAIRVRAEANGDIIQEEMTINDFETGVLVPAVENGTLNRSAAMLMQAGFNSRLSAIKAVRETNGSFSTSRELSRWLKSKQVNKLTSTGHWPTPETSSLWIEFVESFKPSRSKIWKRISNEISVQWHTKSYPPLTKVRLIKGIDSTNVIAANGEIIGQTTPSIKLLKNGVYYAVVSDKDNILDVEYLGAGKNPFVALS